MRDIVGYYRILKEPNLKSVIMRGLLFLLNESNVDYSRAEIVWARDLVLNDLRKFGINDENYSRSEHFEHVGILMHKWINTIYRENLIFYMGLRRIKDPIERINGSFKKQSFLA